MLNAMQGPTEPAVPNLLQTPGVTSLGGFVTMKSNAQLDAEARARAQTDNNAPLIQGLAGYVRKCWTAARTARMQTVDERFYKSIRQRRGEYDPEKLAEIRKTGGSEIYMMLTSVKCRGAASWLRDTLMGVKDEKPWTLKATPVPDMDPTIIQEAQARALPKIQLAAQMGLVSSVEVAKKVLEMAKDEIIAEVKEDANKRAERMGEKMEDQLIEGGWLNALDAFIEDIVTYPAAIMKGPVLFRKKTLAWTQGPDGGYIPQMVDQIIPHWERVDPFHIYPAPHSSAINKGYLLEHHELSRAILESLIGVEGYKEDAIREALDQYSKGGLTESMTNKAAKAAAEGKSTSAMLANPEAPIDALQFWGNVSGKMLLEWGLTEAEVPDKAKEYSAECWVVGTWVIKAVINPDPLGRKPYFKASYENIPGSFWGNGVPDLIRDCQDQCNVAARALANNVGLASGPQVAVNVDRLPTGENITNVFPWKIWQVTTDPFAGSVAQKPIEFFQPTSNAPELMAIYEKFSQMADEYSGVPRYMTGSEGTPGAGRTASGLSMMIGNAGKGLKQVVSNIDVNVINPLLEMLYTYNMQYVDDPDLKGDVQIVARGATQLMVKEQTLVRMIEFLQQTANPIDMQIIGLDGRATVLRELAKKLDMNTDKIVPTAEVIRQRMAMAMMAPPPKEPKQGGDPEKPKDPGSGQQLQDGSETTDNFQPA